jgi:alcohol dehydrogenase
MRFFMPTAVHQERDCVARHAKELAACGRTALIVTGRHSARGNGSLNDVIMALDAQGVRYAVFDQVEENPSVETVMAARDAGLAAKADFVIGIGGGSPLDAAKAAALMLAHPERDWHYLYETADSAALPVAAVPTTCGTGSEVTGVAVLTRHDLGTKVSMTHRVFPVLALVDGKYLLTAPQKILIHTAVDALAHLIESVINTHADAYSDMTAFAGLRGWNECRPYLSGEKALTEQAAQQLMYVSTLAGMSIAQTGTSIPHALSYILTAQGGISHGAAVGVFLANFVQYAEAGRRDAVLRAAGFPDAEALHRTLSAWLSVDADRTLTERAAESVLRNPAKLKTCPYPINAQMMQQIISGI